MKPIKIYRQIDPQQRFLSFDIKKMEAIYDRMGGRADEPHRHSYYTVLLVLRAKGRQIIDFNTFELSGNQVYFISPGQVHQIVEEDKSYGYALTFSEQFLLENGIERRFLNDLYLFQDYGYSPPLELEKEGVEKLKTIAENIFEFVQSDKKFKYQAVGALLKLFLIYCNNMCDLSKEDNTQNTQAAITLLRNFKELLDENFSRWHKVADFAGALHITSDYLNASVKSLTDKTAKEHIQSRLLVEAKRLLRFSDRNIKEIAYALGFSEPANFSQFFKKCTGFSPSAFKKGV